MTRGSLGRLRVIALVLAVLAATGVFLWQVHGHYPIHKWLFWRYAGAWLGALFFALACLSSGFGALRLCLPKAGLRLGERLLFGFSVGLVIFYTGTFVAGVLGLFGGIFFFAFPTLAIASGALPLGRAVLRAARHIRARRARASAPALPALAWLAIGLGSVALLLVYLPILNPENAAFDSRWQHLGIAEHYAVARRIERFPEGWFVGTQPHLAAVLYTWAFTLPASMLFDRVELAAHLEFVCFLTTLPGVVLLVRRLLPRARAPHAWVLRFAFPGLFLYDSGLIIGADHIAAAFAVPVFLALVLAFQALEPRKMVLLGVLLSGVLLTKHTATFLLVSGPVLAVGLRALWLAGASLRTRRFDWLAGVGLCVLTGLVLTSSFWLKNWVWYGNPIYPLGHHTFGGHPWTADATDRFELGFIKAEHWAPPHTLAGVWKTAKVLVTFSFLPNDWPQFHGKVPVLGSLFSLSVLALPFVRPSRRLLGLFALAHVGVFAWYWTHHQDRYLQAAMPWFVAATATVLTVLWRAHLATRLAAVLLVAVQVIWGGDVPAMTGHVFTNQPLEATITLLRTGHERQYEKRLRPFGAFYEAGSVLDRRDKVLVHDSRPRAGLRTRAVSDAPGNQAGISYAELGSPRAAYELLRSLGVTHLFWESGGSKGADNLAGELIFWQFAARFATDHQNFGGHTLAKMPSAPPPAEWNDLALFFGCSTSGLYHVAALKEPGYDGKPKYPPPLEPGPPKGTPVGALASKVSLVAVEKKCHDSGVLGLGAEFDRVAASRSHEFWVRKP
ncbi:MAG: hypothetical protein IPI67_17550 [Myxococcales bacterium]|nr:hypothetical protein [Myxococcales bacterium]